MQPDVFSQVDKVLWTFVLDNDFQLVIFHQFSLLKALNSKYSSQAMTGRRILYLGLVLYALSNYTSAVRVLLIIY